MSTVTKVGLGALIVVAGYAGATVAVGGRVKSSLETSTDTLTKQLPFAKVLEQQYDKGLFSSTRTTKMQLGCLKMPPDENGQPRPREPIVVTWRDRIQHGPLPGLKGVGAAAVDTEIVMSDSVQKNLAELFGTEKPLTIHTLVGWDGSTRTQIASPKATLKDPKQGELVWSGLTGTITRSAQADGPGTVDITFPSLQIKTLQPGNQMSFNQAHVHFEGLSSADSIWVGTGKGDAELASVDMEFAPQHGENGGKPIKGTISNIKYHAETAVDKGFLSSKATFSGAAKIGDVTVNQVQMDVSIKNLHAETYGRMMKSMMAHTLSCDEQADESPAQAMQQLQADLQPLLTYNPEYSLDRLLVEIDGKKGELSYAFGIQGATDADKQTPPMALLMGKGYVKGAAKLPLAWIDKFAAAEGGEGASRAASVRAMLDQFSSQGYVVLDQDHVSSSFKFGQGQIEVNGRPFTPPGMGVHRAPAMEAPEEGMPAQ